MSVYRIVRTLLHRPCVWEHPPEELTTIGGIIVTADLDARTVEIPDAGIFDLDSVIRLADTLRMALDARRTGILDAPKYGPESELVLRWLHRYMHRRGLKDE